MKTSNFGEDLSDLHQEKLAALKKLLPNLFDRDGNLLKSELENFTAGYVLEKPEPFMFSWAGKQQAKGLAFKKSKTKLSLKFDEARSKNFDKTQNLIIEGDNLHVLKLLLPSYKGKVKCIYIDPPYNTQNDFIYPDNFAESEKEYLFNSGQIDLDGDTIIDERLETAGRKHSVWLSMMYPRLVLARELLREDGVIFVSIDDNEVHHLRHLMNEVFGESNCTESIIWESKTKSQNTSGSFNKLQPKTEYILCYSNLTKDKIRFNLQYKGSKEYPEIDEKGNFRYKLLEEMNAAGIRGRESMIFPIKGINPKPGKQWQVGQEAISEFNKRGDVFVKNEQVFLKIRARDERSEIMAPFWGLFSKEIGTAESAKKDLDDLMKISNLFDTVKPVELIKRLLFHATKPGDIILDFFAGSGTTAQAVMELNAEEIEKVANWRHPRALAKQPCGVLPIGVTREEHCCEATQENKMGCHDFASQISLVTPIEDNPLLPQNLAMTPRGVGPQEESLRNSSPQSNSTFSNCRPPLHPRASRQRCWLCQRWAEI